MLIDPLINAARSVFIDALVAGLMDDDQAQLFEDSIRLAEELLEFDGELPDDVRNELIVWTEAYSFELY